MNRRALVRAPITRPPDDETLAADDGTRLGLRQKIDFDFDAFADFVALIDLQKHSGDAEVDDAA